MAKIKESPHLRLRVDPSQLSRLEKAAEKNGRTLTGEINHRLGQSFTKDDFLAMAEVMAEKLGSSVTLKLGDMITKVGKARDYGDAK